MQTHLVQSHCCWLLRVDRSRRAQPQHPRLPPGDGRLLLVVVQWGGVMGEQTRGFGVDLGRRAVYLQWRRVARDQERAGALDLFVVLEAGGGMGVRHMEGGLRHPNTHDAYRRPPVRVHLAEVAPAPARPLPERGRVPSCHGTAALVLCRVDVGCVGDKNDVGLTTGGRSEIELEAEQSSRARGTPLLRLARPVGWCGWEWGARVVRLVWCGAEWLECTTRPREMCCCAIFPERAKGGSVGAPSLLLAGWVCGG